MACGETIRSSSGPSGGVAHGTSFYTSRGRFMVQGPRFIASPDAGGPIGCSFRPNGLKDNEAREISDVAERLETHLFAGLDGAAVPDCAVVAGRRAVLVRPEGIVASRHCLTRRHGTHRKAAARHDARG